MFVEIQDQVVRDDRIARREESDEAADEMRLRVGHLLLKVERVCRKIHLLDAPRILDRVLVHLEERPIRHWPQCEAHSPIENACRTRRGVTARPRSSRDSRAST